MKIRINRDGRVELRDLLLISHRGGRGFGPENTLESLQKALDHGVEMLETDVRMSSDGVPVIHHNPFIGHRLLSRLTLKEIRERGPLIPTLSEFLDVLGNRSRINLEIKRCDPWRLAEVLRSSPYEQPLLVSSFDREFLFSFRRTGYPAEIGLLNQYDAGGERMLRQARECGASVLLPICLIVDEEMVSSAHEEGFKVITWTVNNKHLLASLIDAGIDGVITDEYVEMEDFLLHGLEGRIGSNAVESYRL